MKFVFLKISTAKEKWSELVLENYTEKISHFVQFESISLDSNKKSRDQYDKKIQQEAEDILKVLKPDDYLVLFDENGKDFNSLQFSKEIEKLLGSGKKRVIFLIGGAFGVSDQVKERAQLKIKLAPFVLNHHVAQAVALEQIYRAFTIIKKLPYHNS